jgi:hypothetical protein
MTTLSHLLIKHYYTHRMNYLIKQKMQIKQLTSQYSQLNTIVIRNTLHKVRVNYREGGLYVIYSPEDAQRPRAVYHIQPNFEVIN